MKRLFIFLTLAIILVLAWAPWMSKQRTQDKIFRENANRDGSASANCEYKIFWTPFGRSAISCEGGPYFVPFWFW